eukprot:UN03496
MFGRSSSEEDLINPNKRKKQILGKPQKKRLGDFRRSRSADESINKDFSKLKNKDTCFSAMRTKSERFDIENDDDFKENKYNDDDGGLGWGSKLFLTTIKQKRINQKKVRKFESET